MSKPDDFLVLARVKLNFALKCSGGRVWDEACAQDETGTSMSSRDLCLTEVERAEFLEQARHELRNEPAP